MNCVCGSDQRTHRTEGDWLAIVCDWCGIELAGIDMARLREVHDVEAA